MERAVAVCTGYRCAALLPPGGPGWQALREATAASRGAVLIAAGCSGGCARGPVVALSERLHVQPDGAQPGAVRLGLCAVTWLGPIGPEHLQELCQWLAEPADGAALPAPLPEALRRAAFVPEPG